MLDGYIREEGKNGTVAFDPIEIFGRSTIHVVMRFSMGVDLEDNPALLKRIVKVNTIWLTGFLCNFCKLN